MAVRDGFEVDSRCFSVSFAPEVPACDTDLSPREIRSRLMALQTVLMDLPRHALRLLRRIEKQMRRAASGVRHVPQPDEQLSASFCHQPPEETRIERPPDIHRHRMPPLSPPSGFRAGGAYGWAFA